LRKDRWVLSGECSDLPDLENAVNEAELEWLTLTL
jgi:hypothetical protein